MWSVLTSSPSNSFPSPEEVVSIPTKKWGEGKVEAIVDQVGDGGESFVDHLVDVVDCVEGSVDCVHGNIPYAVRSVHRHLPRGVEGVHHHVADVVSGLHRHVGEVVDHVRHLEHAHDVVVGGGVGVGGAEARVVVRAGRGTRAVWAGRARVVHLPPDDVARLTVVTDVQTDVKLARSGRTRCRQGYSIARKEWITLSFS